MSRNMADYVYTRFADLCRSPLPTDFLPHLRLKFEILEWDPTYELSYHSKVGPSLVGTYCQVFSKIKFANTKIKTEYFTFTYIKYIFQDSINFLSNPRVDTCRRAEVEVDGGKASPLNFGGGSFWGVGMGSDF